ncbi:hypothetical protein AQI88_41115 [Streptomyces cellostaticus]|uniref:Uncharacterized protein n=1 Tax=Streptomyces cellostaticus TaxID=67285 RepID=A0A101N532_9ACTN|nr:hypothetical protein [Streptomyces cellostaticus]KUM86683.1 hypothetical protein AQI88_41115 [Streptomyces cellostaticus]GHI10086.1 hypothetical protein Scel_84070 [Streptomyces cellostaticus]
MKQLTAGAGLLAVAWPVYWLWTGPGLSVAFFLVWLGYILAVDGIVLRRTGTSPLHRGLPSFLRLFAFSVPFWWLYEGLNKFTENWEYVVPHRPGPLGWALLFSLCFSTVLPALFETSELLASFAFFRTPWQGGRVFLSLGLLRATPVVGVLCLVAVAAWPRMTYPLIWVVLFLLLDPWNTLAGRPSLLSQLGRGRWEVLVTLSVAGLICGVFWEMWNAGSAIQWLYDVPGFNTSVHLFEMPLAGYLGYIPFIWSAYAAYHAVHGVLRLPPLPLGEPA